MGKKVHIICAKCGSTNVYFDIDEPSEEDCGVSICCDDCGELTGIEEWNEFNGAEKYIFNKIKRSIILPKSCEECEYVVPLTFNTEPGKNYILICCKDGKAGYEIARRPYPGAQYCQHITKRMKK